MHVKDMNSAGTEEKRRSRRTVVIQLMRNCYRRIPLHFKVKLKVQSEPEAKP